MSTDNIISLAARRNMRNRIIHTVNREICADIARSTSLHPSAQESGARFVERIVRAYLEGSST